MNISSSRTSTRRGKNTLYTNESRKKQRKKTAKGERERDKNLFLSDVIIITIIIHSRHRKAASGKNINAFLLLSFAFSSMFVVVLLRIRRCRVGNLAGKRDSSISNKDLSQHLLVLVVIFLVRR